MRRISRLVATGLLVLGTIAPAVAFAQEARTSIRPTRHRFVRCLAILDLSAEQKAKIAELIEAARPELEADLAAVRATAEALRASLEAQPPDPCQIGSDALALQDARQTLIAAREALREQITGVLTPEQQTRFEGCLDLSWLDADGVGDLLPE